MPDLIRHPPGGNHWRVRERQPCVYMLAKGFNMALYTGATSNLLVRIVQHREGAFDGFTKLHGIKRLVWFEMTDTMEAAFASEKRIQGWLRDWKKVLIEKDNPNWDDLAITLGLPPLK